VLLVYEGYLIAKKYFKHIVFLRFALFPYSTVIGKILNLGRAAVYVLSRFQVAKTWI
jgi:hypothetical protein